MSEERIDTLTEHGFDCRVSGCPFDSLLDSYYCREHEGTQADRLTTQAPKPKEGL